MIWVMYFIILQIIQEHILPKAIKSDESSGNATTKGKTKATNQEQQSILLDNARSVALLLFYKCLTSKERWQLLGQILGFKAKVRVELLNFLKQRNAVMAATSKEQSGKKIGTTE